MTKPNPNFRRPTLAERLWDKIGVTPSVNDCWPWLASTNPAGYGQIHVAVVDGKHIVHLAHREAYEFARGPIPDGLSLDHHCRNHPCCNPWHLEAVPNAVNIQRGLSRFVNLDKTHCPRGHAYTPENTYIGKSGSRFCKACPMVKYHEKRAAAL